jgi:transcriptional regulator with XRE-family HTH domain
VPTAARRARSPLLHARDAERVRETLHGFSGELIDRIDVDVRQALAGSERAAAAYVRDYRLLTGHVLAEARRANPELVMDTGDGRLGVADGNGRPTRTAVALIEHASAVAPFSPWAAGFPLGDAVALDLTNRVRALVGARPLRVPADAPAQPQPTPDDLAAERFLRRVRHHLDHPDESPLRRIMDTFGLSKTELGRMFGVSRQAVDQWLGGAVPSERQEKLATLLAVVDLLERKLKPGRLPGVARRPADVYDGQTMLDFVAADRHRELLEKVRASFDWATAA